MNVVYFHLDSKEAEENITKQFKIKKFPAIILKPINSPFDNKSTLNLKIDVDNDDLLDEIHELFKNSVIDISEKTVG